ncbi:hypothetical protein ACFLYO_02155 [Chloroflexota bacterium]
MAQGKSSKKDRLNEIVVVGFVIVTMALLIVQLGLDVVDTIEQQNMGQDEVAQTVEATATPPVDDATPAEPTPTFDIGSVPVSEFGN